MTGELTGELTGKVAIVTGGANGIGRAAVELFVAEGARVVIADVDVQAGESLAAEIGGAEAQCLGDAQAGAVEQRQNRRVAGRDPRDSRRRSATRRVPRCG